MGGGFRGAVEVRPVFDDKTHGRQCMVWGLGLQGSRVHGVGLGFRV